MKGLPYIQKGGSYSQHIVFPYVNIDKFGIKISRSYLSWSVDDDRSSYNNDYQTYNLIPAGFFLSTILPYMITQIIKCFSILHILHHSVLIVFFMIYKREKRSVFSCKFCSLPVNIGTSYNYYIIFLRL